MTKEIVLVGIPLLITIGYIVYRIVVNVKEDGIFNIGPIHIATRKYKITSSGYKKPSKKKIRRVPLIVLLLVLGLYILIVSFFVYGDKAQAVKLVSKSLKTMDRLTAPAASKLTFDDLLDKGMKVIGFLSALGGMVLTFREMFERKSNKSKK